MYMVGINKYFWDEVVIGIWSISKFFVGRNGKGKKCMLYRRNGMINGLEVG